MNQITTDSREESRFGPYELRSLLGKGGMGEVYEAYDTVKDRTVALKLLSPDLAHDPTYQERFRRESRAAARLREPHIIPIHDWGEIDGVLFIDMRLVAGHDLRTTLRAQGPMSPSRAVAIVAQVASALDAAHADNLIHRDIKPENILLTRDDFAYLVDFGIARSGSDVQLTTQGTAIGSYAYMAPERFDADVVTDRADTYSLACVLYECLTATAPYPATSVSQLIKAHLMTAPPRASLTRPGLPRALDAVVVRGLAKDPDERFASTGDFARAAHLALTPPDRAEATAIVGRTLDGTAVGSVGEYRQTKVGDAVHPRPQAWGTAAPPPPPRPNAAPDPFAQPGPHRSTFLPVAITLLVVLVLGLGAAVAWLTLAPDIESNTAAVPSAAAPISQSAPNVEAKPPTAVVPTVAPVAPVAPTRARAIPVSGADSQGFLGNSGPRCNADNLAVAIGRTTDSKIVVCETGVGRYYYKGVRITDAAGIELDDPRPSAGGFVATNPADGTQYRLDGSSLTIVSDGEVVAAESMREYYAR
ncbi:serine/threonine protein kinase [Rhodococcus sp. PAMC28707]|uniref:serine/threonine-protein kinase n=1 Tax=unclassified Rhodococcus (in: high G+C Gram-positive bacteria) TaxID=192944 RepID=UPI00109DD1E5|nr:MULTISPECIES: serine/threonine-protein kinase [unclassified Rhodococcus (in: high G+C Gram-positive bacteria)]QCB51263.1 serine/threonine protein kinase [Rhodococcus sp. PAMC28705]QCB60569.1 serine/threonine protein kinase [Rhodococcus sp. PAMC28707]